MFKSYDEGLTKPARDGGRGYGDIAENVGTVA